MTRLLIAIRSNPLTTVGIVLGIVAVIAVGLRGEDTRDIIQQSPCTAAPASAACQQTKRQSDKARSVRDTCIAFKRVGYRCPVGEVREEVVEQQGSSPSQPPGPPSGGSPVPNVPSTPEPPVKPGTPPVEPSPEPVTPDPVTPEPSGPEPLIDLTPVTEPVCQITRPVITVC